MHSKACSFGAFNHQENSGFISGSRHSQPFDWTATLESTNKAGKKGRQNGERMKREKSPQLKHLIDTSHQQLNKNSCTVNSCLWPPAFPFTNLQFSGTLTKNPGYREGIRLKPLCNPSSFWFYRIRLISSKAHPEPLHVYLLSKVGGG